MYPNSKMLPKKGRIFPSDICDSCYYLAYCSRWCARRYVAATRHPYPIETACFVRRIVSQIFLYVVVSCEWVSCVRGEAQSVADSSLWWGCSQQTAWAFSLQISLVLQSLLPGVSHSPVVLETRQGWCLAKRRPSHGHQPVSPWTPKPLTHDAVHYCFLIRLLINCRISPSW